ncbi:MAG: nickel/cobalt transporter, partial [Gemmataceae bacterium]
MGPALIVLLLSAHPVPKDNRDRTLIVRPTPAALVVELRLEIDESRAARDLPVEDLTAVKDRAGLLAAFQRHAEATLGGGLAVTLDGQELDLRCTARAMKVTDHVRCDFRYEAPWRLSPAGSRFTFRECNHEIDGVSLIDLTLSPSAGVTARDVAGPEKRRTLRATLSAEPGERPWEARPALPPDAEVREAGRPRHGGRDKPLAGEPAVAGRGGAYDVPDVGHGDWDLMHLLLNTEAGTGVLLVLAALFGAVHALTPGHGKALVAAYLIGEKGTAWHAVVLGVVTTLTHTSSVLVIALALPLLFPGAPPKSVQAAIGLVGGALIAATGLWLLMQRLAGRADHSHFEADDAAPRWRQLIALGVSGGIVPCWDAIGMLLFAVAAGRLWMAVPLLLAFSAGLAAVLVAVGIAVVRARAMLLGNDGEPRLGR